MRLFSRFRNPLDAGQAGRQKLRRRLHQFLVLWFSLVIAIPITASVAVAAPPAIVFIVPTTFHMNASVWSPMCAGYTYNLKVSVRTDYQGTMGGTAVQVSDAFVPGIVINASSNNPGVATVSPARSVSGVLGGGNGLGEVTFSVHAAKAGSTTILLRGVVPAQLTQSSPLSLAIFQPIEVNYCAYRISENGSWSISFPNLRTGLTDTLRGKILTTGSGDQLGGTGDVTWSLRSFSVMCSHSHSLTLDHANMTGQPSGDNLAVRLEFGPVGFSTVNCGSSNEGQFQPPVMYGAGDSSGFTAGGSFPFKVGNFNMGGRWTMSVTPLILH
jgi:hypothetical protein